MLMRRADPFLLLTFILLKIIMYRKNQDRNFFCPCCKKTVSIYDQRLHCGKYACVECVRKHTRICQEKIKNREQ